MNDDIKRIKAKIRKAADNAIKQKIFTSALGKILASDIKIRTRLGKGAAKTGAKLKGLKPLSKKYKKQRTRDKKKGQLSTKTTPARSNLTRSGQLIDAITSKGEVRQITVYFNEDRDDGETNSKIVGYQEDQGRPFFYISDSEKTRLERLVRKKIELEIKKLG